MRIGGFDIKFEAIQMEISNGNLKGEVQTMDENLSYLWNHEI